MCFPTPDETYVVTAGIKVAVPNENAAYWYILGLLHGAGISPQLVDVVDVELEREHLKRQKEIKTGKH